MTSSRSMAPVIYLDFESPNYLTPSDLSAVTLLPDAILSNSPRPTASSQHSMLYGGEHVTAVSASPFIDYIKPLTLPFANTQLTPHLNWSPIAVIKTTNVRQETSSETAKKPVTLSTANYQGQKASPEVLAEWDGYVEEIHRDYFTARMRGLQGKGVAGKNEEAEIPISDVDDEDRELLAIGAFFRLTITYELPKVGPKRRFTTLQFRRLPAFTKRELDEADKLADKLFNGLQLESRKGATGG